jgi:hypothetical protein
VEEKADEPCFDAIVETTDVLPHDGLHIHGTDALVLVVSNLELLPSII